MREFHALPMTLSGWRWNSAWTAALGDKGPGGGSQCRKQSPTVICSLALSAPSRVVPQVPYKLLPMPPDSRASPDPGAQAPEVLASARSLLSLSTTPVGPLGFLLSLFCEVSQPKLGHLPSSNQHLAAHTF